MRLEVVNRLLDINRGFYQSFAEPFSSKRDRLQPGVVRVLGSLPLEARLLDLGCAHGSLAKALNDQGFSGRYVGLDASQALLDRVPQELEPPRYTFKLADLAYTDWPEIAGASLFEISSPGSDLEHQALFDRVLAFAMLHHLPSDDLRMETAAAVRSLLVSGGSAAVSVWDFLASARLRERVTPWSEVGLDESDVEEGDHLVDWREGGTGHRYVHHFADGELRALAEGAGFEVRRSYRSDGENDRLGHYQIWVPAPRS